MNAQLEQARDMYMNGTTIDPSPVSAYIPVVIYFAVIALAIYAMRHWVKNA